MGDLVLIVVLAILMLVFIGIGLEIHSKSEDKACQQWNEKAVKQYNQLKPQINKIFNENHLKRFAPVCERVEEVVAYKFYYHPKESLLIINTDIYGSRKVYRCTDGLTLALKDEQIVPVPNDPCYNLTFNRISVRERFNNTDSSLPDGYKARSALTVHYPANWRQEN